MSQVCVENKWVSESLESIVSLESFLVKQFKKIPVTDNLNQISINGIKDSILRTRSKDSDVDCDVDCDVDLIDWNEVDWG